ncbi:MAG: hypothetical protein JSS53_06515 [Proteobacteria bacterium]|nr:hypothetical protein [Pseudomonadota bacterium]
MSILSRFKEDLQNVITLYSNRSKMTMNRAKEITDLLHMINQAMSAVGLFQNIQSFIPKMHGLNFIIDFNSLRKGLLSLLNKPIYQLFNLLLYENMEMRHEMKQLRIQITSSVTDPNALKPLNDRIVALEGDLSSLQKKSERLQVENNHLCEALKEQKETNDTLLREKTDLQKNTESLQDKYLAKIEECRKLYEEIHTLKETPAVTHKNTI